MTHSLRICLLAAALVAPFAAAQGVTADHNGLAFEGANYKFAIGGRLHADTVSVKEDVTTFPNKSDIRRLRIDGTLTVADDWRFKVDGDVGGKSPGFKNVWARYNGLENTSIKVGNFIAPFSGEDMMSSNDIKLMERSLASSLAPNFLTGGAVAYKGDQWSISAGYFGDPLDQDPLRVTDKGESWVARLVWAPIKEKRRVVHLAAAIENRQLNDQEVSKVSAAPEFGLSGVSLLKTGRQAEVTSYTNYNAEAAFMQGPFLLKGQYISRANDASAIGDPTYSGASVEAAWVVTGERQRYSVSGGTFGGIRPRGKFGAVELVARYSTLDLNDGLVTGGEQTNWSGGVNWYITRNLRLMGNYVRADTNPGANGINEKIDAVMGRIQIAY